MTYILEKEIHDENEKEWHWYLEGEFSDKLIENLCNACFSMGRYNKAVNKIRIRIKDD